MASPYVGMTSGGHPELLGRLPLSYEGKDGGELRIEAMTAADVASCAPILNEAIADGDSYPYEEELSEEAFAAYFLSHDAFVCRSAADGAPLGIFYIKPNFPGRCGHICNGGFVTSKQARGRGVATAMARAFVLLAPDLGYRASFFNLVFANNVGSVRLWEKMGFTRTGTVPQAARIITGEYVDAYQYWYSFVPSGDESGASGES